MVAVLPFLLICIDKTRKRKSAGLRSENLSEYIMCETIVLYDNDLFLQWFAFGGIRHDNIDYIDRN